MHIKTTKIPIPALPVEAAQFAADYADAYAFEWRGSKQLSAVEVTVKVWTDWPRWLRLLENLRDLLVKPFGLKGDKELEALGGSRVSAMEQFATCIREGTNFGPFSILSRKDGDILMYMPDDHLDFQLLVRSEAPAGDMQQLHVVTLVHYNKTLGRVYFAFIRPFHKMVVILSVKRIIRLMNSYK